MSTHEKLILFTAQAYFEAALKDGTTQEPLHKKIATAIEAWKMLRRFSAKERNLVVKIGEDEYMQKLKAEGVSFVVYALELIKLWADDADYRKSSINISKKRLRMGRATFAVEMLKLKQKDEEKHKELREIIDVSVLTAKNFYHYTKEKISEAKKEAA